MKTLSIFSFFLFLYGTNASAQFTHQLRHNDTLQEVLILSSEQQLGKELVLTGKVKAPDPIGFKNYDFDTQLDRIAGRAIEDGAKIILIDKIEQAATYRLKGRAYKAKDYEFFKNSILQTKKAKLAAKAKCGTLTLYRPAPSYHLNDLVKIELLVNDVYYVIKPNTKIRLLYDTTADITLKIKGAETDTTISLQCGAETYVRCQVYPPNTTFVAVNTIAVPISGYIRTIKITDAKLGELESKQIDLTTN